MKRIAIGIHILVLNVTSVAAINVINIAKVRSSSFTGHIHIRREIYRLLALT